MINKILAFIQNKYLLAIAIVLFLYASSWFLWVGRVIGENKSLTTNRKVFVYSYEWGMLTGSFNNYLENHGMRPFSGFRYAENFEAEKRIHYFYYPIEILATVFNVHYCKDFYRNNFEALIKINNLTDENKLKLFNKLGFDQSKIIWCKDISNFVYAVGNEAVFFEYEYFGIYKSNSEEITVPFYNSSRGSMYFSFEEYKQFVMETKKFARWFNDLNITESNPNFSKEFVLQYRAFIDEKRKK